MLASVFQTCEPRPEILSGNLQEDIFAAKIRPVVEGKAPQVYQDPQLFFANTFRTDGLATLIREVFGRLTGANAGSPVIRLETSFGGGKTHDQIALWHICRQGRYIQGLDEFIDISLIPETATQVAAVDGKDLDPESGVFHEETGITTYTLWGEIAYQIGGMRGYELLKRADESGSSPGTSVLERLVAGQGTVIVIDEIARHLRVAQSKTIGDSTLSKQVVAFLFSLMDFAAAANNIVLVYSLASASDTFSDETAELNELIRSSARQERVISPSTDIEIYNIVKQRVFQSVNRDAAAAAAREYLSVYRQAKIDLPDSCKENTYSEAIENSYPFHPELFRLLTQKIASIPEFQRTRGALRLFGRVVQHLWLHRDSSYVPLIHPHHVPVGESEEITNELTSRLQHSSMRPPIQADIYNRDGRAAYAQEQDQEWRVADKPPFPSWVARTIFLHSITQGISSGIKRPELNLSLLTPGVEIGVVDDVLDGLAAVAWYLDDDAVTTTARFKEEPSINKIISQEKNQIGRTQVKEKLRSRRDSIFASKIFTLVTSPDSPSDVDDVADSIALCILDFDEATVQSSQDPPPQLVEKIYQNTGESGKFRLFRNRLLFLVANQGELEKAMERTREYLAIQSILNSSHLFHELSESQQKQLRDRDASVNLEVRVALTNTYRHLFYPAKDKVKAPKGLMHYTLPAQDSSTIKGNSNQQDVILKALQDCGKARSADAKELAPAYVLQKAWPAGMDSLSTKKLREQFSKEMGLSLPLDAETPKLRKTICQGLESGQWDLKIGDRVYIKTKNTPFQPPETIEFSDHYILYRRGILEPPKPREIELNAQVFPSSHSSKTVRVRWRVREAIAVTLYRNGTAIEKDFQISDEYEDTIEQNTVYRLVADYGNGETDERETVANISNFQPSTTYTTPDSQTSTAAESQNLFQTKPKQLTREGTPNRVLTELNDYCSDNQVRGIEKLQLSVTQLLDYRKLGTAIPLLNQFRQLKIDQTATVETQNQSIRLEYRGDIRGFQSFFSTLNNFLNQPDVRAEVFLELTLDFDPVISPDGPELRKIRQALGRNEIDRLKLEADLVY